jgi:hypothetical protein
MKLTEIEQARIDRIIAEVTAKIPQRIYADDSLFLLQIIERLVNRIEELENESNR